MTGRDETVLGCFWFKVSGFTFQVLGSKFPNNLKHETSNLKPSIETLHEQRATDIVVAADRRLQQIRSLECEL
jgi:hypothetical protein